MTSPYAPIGLTYAGTDLQSADFQIFLKIIQGLDETPSVRGVDYVVPALAGQVEANRVNDVLAITLEGIVTANPASVTTATAYATCQANRATVRALFASNRARADLVATMPTGQTRTISARPMPGIIWTELVEAELYKVSIELQGYDDWTTGTVPSPGKASLTLTTFAPVVS